MSKIIPIFTSDKTLADKLALASIHNVDYEYIDLTLFEESYSRYADHGGVVVAYLKDDEITFIEKVSSFQKKMKKNNMIVALILDDIDPLERDKISIETNKMELIFCLNEKSPIAIKQELNDLLSMRQYLVSLQRKSDDMKVMAYQAMETASEIGLVTMLLEKSSSVTNKDEMMSAVLNTLASFNVKGSILYMSDVLQQEFYLPDDGDIKKNELQVMSAFRAYVDKNPQDGRFKMFGNRLLVSGKHITLLVKHLPESEDNLGRIRDTLGALINAADAIAFNVENSIAKEKREEVVSHVVSSVAESVNEVQGLFKVHEKKVMITMDELIRKTEDGLSVLGLTLTQENYFLENLEQAMHNLVSMYSDGIAIENKLENIMNNMKKIQKMS